MVSCSRLSIHLVVRYNGVSFHLSSLTATEEVMETTPTGYDLQSVELLLSGRVLDLVHADNTARICDSSNVPSGIGQTSTDCQSYPPVFCTLEVQSFTKIDMDPLLN